MITSEELRADDPGQMDDIFEILVTSYTRATQPLGLDEDLTWRPATDAYTTEGEFIVQIDLAGMDPTGIEVLTDGDSLTIRGTRSDIAPAGKKHYFKMEINVGPFVRKVALTIDVDPASATAQYRSGFLYVTFRKGSGDQGHRRQITIDR